METKTNFNEWWDKLPHPSEIDQYESICKETWNAALASQAAPSQIPTVSKSEIVDRIADILVEDHIALMNELKTCKELLQVHGKCVACGNPRQDPTQEHFVVATASEGVSPEDSNPQRVEAPQIHWTDPLNRYAQEQRKGAPSQESVAWMSKESEYRLRKGGNSRGTVPVHKERSVASRIPLYTHPSDAAAHIASLENNMRMWIDAGVDLTKTNDQLREQIAKLEATWLSPETYEALMREREETLKQLAAAEKDAARLRGKVFECIEIDGELWVKAGDIQSAMKLSPGDTAEGA